jgi:hypothetical protein
MRHRERRRARDIVQLKIAREKESVCACVCPGGARTYAGRHQTRRAPCGSCPCDGMRLLQPRTHPHTRTHTHAHAHTHARGGEGGAWGWGGRASVRTEVEESVGLGGPVGHGACDGKGLVNVGNCTLIVVQIDADGTHVEVRPPLSLLIACTPSSTQHTDRERERETTTRRTHKETDTHTHTQTLCGQRLLGPFVRTGLSHRSGWQYRAPGGGRRVRPGAL